jgi:hypothetical protein
MSSKDLIQPENHGAWASATQTLLGNAKSVTDELFAALKDKDIVPPHIPKPLPVYVNPGPKNKADLDTKLREARLAENIVDTAAQRISTVIHRLGHEQQKKWAPLQVCEWRLKLRARRPPRELFNDHVQEALVKEELALKEARVKLMDLANEGKGIIEDCEANKARLVRVLRLMVQQGTAKLTPLDWTSMDGESPPCPSSPSSPAADGGSQPADADEVSTAKAKPHVPCDTEGLLKRAPELQEIALNFVKKGDDAIRIQQNKCNRAQEHVTVCLKKRWAENEEVRKTLEQQIRAMHETIENAEKSLVKMKKRIDHFGEVEIQPKYDSAQALLIKLRESKAQLEDDLHHKLVSMKIDECCRKITPERTAVPPEQLPVMAMLEGPACRKKNNMKASSSSPALVGVNSGTGRPGSPAGISSPLKAAGMSVAVTYE